MKPWSLRKRKLVGKPGLEPGRLAAHDPKSCSSTNSDTSPRGEHGHYSPASFRDAIEHGWVNVRGRGVYGPQASDWEDSLASPVVRPRRRGRERTGRPVRDGGGLDLFQPVDHHPQGHVDQLAASVVKPLLPAVHHRVPVSSISQPLVQPNHVPVADRHFRVDFVQRPTGGDGLDGLYQSRSHAPAAESRSNVEREQAQRALPLKAVSSHADGPNNLSVQLGHKHVTIPEATLLQPPGTCAAGRSGPRAAVSGPRSPSPAGRTLSRALLVSDAVDLLRLSLASFYCRVGRQRQPAGPASSPYVVDRCLLFPPGQPPQAQRHRHDRESGQYRQLRPDVPAPGERFAYPVRGVP